MQRRHSARPLPWRAAMQEALYGEGGFYRRPEGPAGHFRTSAHASPLFARALARLAREAGLRTVVDVGAGRGELLRALHAEDPRLRLLGVELAPRPDHVPDGIEWHTHLPETDHALLVANEWLDVVPLDVVEVTDDGPRLVLVDQATGEECLGDPPAPEDRAWLDRWWPLENAASGDRAELGRSRDEAWAAAAGSLRSGLAVAVDYATTREDRRAGRHAAGTLTAYAGGHQVAPVPDGSCDLTAHVALDACAAAAPAGATLLTTQREALRALGLTTARPAYDLAVGDPAGYLTALQRHGEEAELTDPHGLGGFGWLVQAVRMPLPASLQRVVTSSESTPRMM